MTPGCFHPWAWIAWAAATLTVLSATRNPMYLALVLCCIVLVGRLVPTDVETVVVPLSPLRFGFIVVGLSALFNAASVHVGSHVLIRLPAGLPLVGGPITLEALTYGALNGLSLTGIFALFALLNRTLPVRSLVRLIPRAFYPVAVVVSIAVTYVPTTLRQFQLIREAQAVRGHRVRGLRDWLPLFMPLLIGGLERAVQLAEAMMARGFAAHGERMHDTLTRLLVTLGLLALLTGWLAREGWHQEYPGLMLMLAGVGLVLLALWIIGRRVPHTTYRHQEWAGQDTAIVAGAFVAACALCLPLPGLDRSTIFFYPYLTLGLPGLNGAVGVGILGLLGPAMCQLHGRARSGVASAAFGKADDRRPSLGGDA